MRPGLDEVWQSPGLFMRAFSSEDLPTLERPRKATSGEDDPVRPAEEEAVVEVEGMEEREG